MANWSDRAFLASLLTLFLCRAALASGIVPPWQGPDEPGHFVSARLLSVPYAPLDPVQATLEAQVLESMARHRWWEPYNEAVPVPLPRRLSEPTAHQMAIPPFSQSLYHGLAAAVLRLAPASTVDGAYWRLRILSIALGAVTLAAAWAGTHLLFGPAIAAGATALAALHPQFLLAAIAINADALVILQGALMWWLVGRVARNRRPAMSLLLLVVIAVSVVITKRSALPLGIVALMVTAGSLLNPRIWSVNLRASGWMAWFFAAAAAVGWAIWNAFEEPLRYLLVYWQLAMPFRRPDDQVTTAAALEYARVSVDNAWLKAGWLRFPASEPWFWVTRILTVAGLAGAAGALIRSADLRRPLLIAWLFVIVHAGSVLGWGFLTLSVPQGRYLLPVLGPATVLLWVGITRAVPFRARPYVASGLVATAAVLDLTAFTTVLMPAYLR